MGTLLTSAARWLRDALPGFDITASPEVLAERTRTWARPAVQMGIASALAYWAASQLAGDAAGYAPITAIAALGLGRERRLGRSGLLVGGLFLGVVAAEIVTPVIGSGWWQIGLIIAVSAIVAGSVVGHDLAVTYATINAALLLTTPGSDGWLPSRVVAGLLGVAAALAMILLIAPPHAADLLIRRLDRAADRAAELLTRSADALAAGSGLPSDGDRRELLVAAGRLDDELDRSHDAADQAGEVVRWSPRRRGDADEVGRVTDLARDLRPALRTASTIARLVDRATLAEVRAPDDVVRSIRDGAGAVSDLARRYTTDERVDDDLDDELSAVLRRIMDVDVDRAVLIGLKEEIRGLIADLVAIGGGSPAGAPATLDRARGAARGGVVYGRL